MSDDAPDEDVQQPVEDTSPPDKKARQQGRSVEFPVVGLGASAGGLKALLQFFEGMPAKSNMAFVVIMHLSPQHESHAAEVLQNATRMPVMQVNEAVHIEPNHVYVIPPTKHLAMTDGSLSLSEPEKRHGRHVAIDLFFRTLADAHTNKSIGIVLSGTGSDGTVGLKRVKERGGVAIAQTPEDAEYDSMPRSAIATGVVDFVLPAAEMPNKLVQLWQNASVIQLPPTEGVPGVIIDKRQTAEEALRDILALLRTRTGHDFTHYKRATVLRRIERRLQVNELKDLPAYRDFLRMHADEAQALLKDMLISVTNFFRDREAFEALERDTIPSLFRGKAAGDQVRAWVAGCATGEEAYSIAMLLCEHASALPHPPQIQVFATDIDEAALAVAREGSYTESIVTDVPPSRLRHFFTKEPGGYRVKKGVRERVLFATHNLIKDPPFSKLDLITCRNLLIYLNREVQEQIFELFHFALKPGGYLFLGSAESSADGALKLFSTLDKKHHIYRSNTVARTALHVPTLPLGTPYGVRRATQNVSEDAGERRHVAFGELHQKLLEQYAPPSVIVDGNYDIVHLSDRAGRFLQSAGGEPSHNLLKVVHPELRLDLRTALFQAAQTGKSTEARRVRLLREDHIYYVNMIVRPVHDPETTGAFTLVLFDEVEETLGIDGKETQDGEAEPIARQLEAELHRTKEQLQATIEQYETQAEELKASNEELQAINEELRSTTEELETSKEELQSINEELTTVNQELKNKIEEVTSVNDDLQNLIASTDIGVVFLDRTSRIKRFTPRATDIFNLISSDVGRPLLDITHRLDYAELHGDTEEVFSSLRPIEREVRSTDDRWYIARILPYRTTEDRIDGAVLTFVDITTRKLAEERLRQSEERLRLLVESAADYAIVTLDAEGRISLWNTGAQRQFGYTDAEITGQPAEILFTPEDRAAGVPADEMRRARETGSAADERWHLRRDGTRFYVSGVMTALSDGDGTFHGYAKIARDLTEHKLREEELRELARKLEQQTRIFDTTLSSITDFAYIFDRDGRFVYANKPLLDLWGLTLSDAVGKNFFNLQYPDDLAAKLQRQIQQVFDTKQELRDETPYTSPTGAGGYYEYIFNPVVAADNTVEVVAGSTRDITEHKRMTESLRESEAALRGAHDVLEAKVAERTGELAESNQHLQAEVAERKRGEEMRQLLLRRIITSQEDERQRISRELHDHFGQELSAFHLILERLRQRCDEEQSDLCELIVEAQEASKRLDDNVDFLAWELRPTALDDLGLPAAVGNYVREWSKRFQLPAAFHTANLNQNLQDWDTHAASSFRVVASSVSAWSISGVS